MSYLSATRIHFAGQFRADVSTVNNKSSSFDSDSFTPGDQEFGDGSSAGMWQPTGTGAWRISDCVVTSALIDEAVVADDPVVGLLLKGSGDRVDAKIVDLDPQQQMVSTIFGLEMRIVDPKRRAVLMSGLFTPAAFMDISRDRSPAAQGPGAAGAYYQSTLTHVEWDDDLSVSPALTAIRDASAPGLLSVRFMVDRFEMAKASDNSDRRGYGRIVGTIGPALVGEPAHFVAGRHLSVDRKSLVGPVQCRLDTTGSRILVDLGNAMQMDEHGVPKVPQGIHLLAKTSTGVVDLGALGDVSKPNSYPDTAGIHAFPPDRTLHPDEEQAAATHPLALGIRKTGGGWTAIAAEAPDGIYARTDEFVVRLNPGDSAKLELLVTRFGAPLAGSKVDAEVYDVPGILGDDSNTPVATPLNALTTQIDGLTGADGRTTLTINGTDPRNPRGHVDGQVYGVRYSVEGAKEAGTAFWRSSLFVSVLLFDDTPVPATVTWNGDVLPILTLYANLYPRPHGQRVNYDPKYDDEPNPPALLHPVVSLTDKDWVASYAQRILTALKLPFDHPNHMPVTRDLSAGRRGILVRWMQQVLDGKIPDEPAPASPNVLREVLNLRLPGDEVEEPKGVQAEPSLQQLKSGATFSRKD